MELTIIPAIVLASQDYGIELWELVIILIIALILLGVRRLSDLRGMARGMAESICKFKSVIAPEPSPQSTDYLPWVFIVLALFAAAVILSVLGLYDFSDKQKLVLTIVLLGWIGVGYWSFGRNLRK
jgi:hypothetical protein